jgi:hypothetical protein
MNTGYLKVPVSGKPAQHHLYDAFLERGTVYTQTTVPVEAYIDVYMEHPDFTVEDSEPVYVLIFDTYYDGYNRIAYIAQLATQTHGELSTVKIYDKDHFTDVISTVTMTEEAFFNAQSVQKEENNG